MKIMSDRKVIGKITEAVNFPCRLVDVLDRSLGVFDIDPKTGDVLDYKSTIRVKDLPMIAIAKCLIPKYFQNDNICYIIQTPKGKIIASEECIESLEIS